MGWPKLERVNLSDRAAMWKWWVCAALLLATFLNYMDRQALAVTLPELKQRYNIAEARIGLIEGYFAYAFAVGSILFGLLADRFGPRRLYPVVLAGWSAAGIATAFTGQPVINDWLTRPGDDPGAGPFRWLFLCRTALGLFESGHWPCALITARQILSAKDRPLGNAILQSGASAGTIIVTIYIEAVQQLGGGWQVPFWTIGFAGLFWLPLWFALVRRGDLDQPTPPPAVDGTTRSWGVFLRLLVVLAIVVSCLNISWQFLRAWLTMFLQDFHHYSPSYTRGVVVAYFVATDVGCLLAGALAKQLTLRGWSASAARKLGFAVFAALTALAALVPLIEPGPVMILFLLLAGAGILGLHPYYYALVQELPARRMGLLSGCLAAFGWAASGRFQIAIGARIEETHSYDVGLYIVGLAPTVALIVLLLFSPRGANRPS
jgi:ACS family hexuronate transporter-like MFS transporter